MKLFSVRVPSILVVASVASLLSAGMATGAQPKEGGYAGTGADIKIDFKVKDSESDPSKVKGFDITGQLCGVDNVSTGVPKAMKVKSSGKFAYDGEAEGATGSDIIVEAKFTANKTATGELFITACPLAGQYEFVIKKGGGDEVEHVSTV